MTLKIGSRSGVTAVQQQKFFLGGALLQPIDQPLQAHSRTGDSGQIEVFRRQIHFSVVVPVCVAGNVDDQLIIRLDPVQQLGNPLLEPDLADVGKQQCLRWWDSIAID